MQPLDRTETLDWLQLIRTQNIGPITFHRLIARFGSAGKALASLPDLARKAGGGKPLRAADRHEAEEELFMAEKRGARFVAFCEPDYPAALKSIADPPPVLCMRGHASLFEKPAVAIIGARNASGVGRKIARNLAADLGAAGFVVTSGLARGIDGEAHQASLGTGTIAVIAGGIDVIYPPEHDELTERIAKEGVLLSESAIGHKPTARDFPRRNRLISGLSSGVIIIEAAERSGTLHTARFAGEQGREVFVVPGSPLDPRYAGSINLIREGATCIRNAQDVIDDLSAQMRGVDEGRRSLFDWAEDQPAAEPDENAVKAAREAILELLTFTPMHRDEILRATELSLGLFADALLDLALAGEALETGGGFICRAPEN